MGAHSILFVCLGNICRSPLAEGVFRAVVEERGITGNFLVDSAGLGAWHAGNCPDSRSIAIARANGVDISGQRARKISSVDFRQFGLILGMDRSNIAELERLAPVEARDRIHLFLDFAGEPGKDIPDPYYGDTRDFEAVYLMVRRACETLASKLA